LIDTRKTIMICDDEPDLLSLYKKALETDYEVIIVDSGKGCIDQYVKEKHRGRSVHVLLLDYKLGDMLGDIVACKISELNGVKTLLISAYDLDQTMVDDLIERRCIVGTLKKPIRIPMMIQQIEQVLRNHN
jgi:response regulator RpfG family c-di-GMP phosphodiesterase